MQTFSEALMLQAMKHGRMVVIKPSDSLVSGEGANGDFPQRIHVELSAGVGPYRVIYSVSTHAPDGRLLQDADCIRLIDEMSAELEKEEAT